jgi:carboxyvinyl-carboxyphosphonate phosphorylmutase
MKKTTLLKKSILAPEILVMPGAHDVLSARIIEKSGFNAFFVGGYAVSATLLGKPDISLLTLTEMAGQAARLNDATDIPFLIDADTGYGGVLNVARTVREMERAGAAGLFIEDQVFPKRCGHMDGKQVIAPEDMIAKIKAAMDARSDPDFIIMARTDALAVYGIQEAIDRGTLYREAGADAIFVEAPMSRDDMSRINREIDAPTAANMVEGGKTPFLRAKELETLGFNMVLFPVSATYALAKAVEDIMVELKQTGTTKGLANRMWQFGDFYRFIDVEAFRAKERTYLEHGNRGRTE